jgi:hypothetical protein
VFKVKEGCACNYNSTTESQTNSGSPGEKIATRKAEENMKRESRKRCCENAQHEKLTGESKACECLEEETKAGREWPEGWTVMP